MKPRVCILKTAGTNCDQETVYAFQKAGATVETVLISTLQSEKKLLDNFQILVIPGGFSYGDDIISGKVFALELLCMHDTIEQFIARNDTLIIGICNGFQVLIRMGLLPCGTIGNMQATLTTNNSAKFECRWVDMVVEQSPCLFTQTMPHKKITLQVAHAEGKFFADNATLKYIEDNNLVVLRYATPTTYPTNPNGSLHGIAGICDPSGKIFGLMPHPERFVEKYQYPNWRSQNNEAPHGLPIFENAVKRFV